MARRHYLFGGKLTYGAAARFHLGQAYSIAGDRSRAKSAFESLVTTWKKADQDIPILKKAYAELAKL